MLQQDFVDQLRAMGYTPEERGENRLAFRYTIPVGRLTGQEIWLGLVVNGDFPANPPSGPHVSPRLLPLHPCNDLPHPQGGVHESPFDGGGSGTKVWQYWSRPFHGWANTDRTVKTYMAHIRKLFATI